MRRPPFSPAYGFRPFIQKPAKRSKHWPLGGERVSGFGLFVMPKNSVYDHCGHNDSDDHAGGDPCCGRRMRGFHSSNGFDFGKSYAMRRGVPSVIFLNIDAITGRSDEIPAFLLSVEVADLYERSLSQAAHLIHDRNRSIFGQRLRSERQCERKRNRRSCHRWSSIRILSLRACAFLGIARGCVGGGDPRRLDGRYPAAFSTCPPN
jgi:hypothetical protein